MNLSEELKQYAKLMPHDELVKAVEMPASICPEEISAILPSIRFESDGLVLNSLFLVTPHYLCEVHLAHEAEQQFDYISLGTIMDYRFQLWEHVVESAGDGDIHYQLARITLIHGLTPEFTSVLTYAGFDRESWLHSVIEALPISLVLHAEPLVT